MAKLFFRQEAINDINDIWKYTFENWSLNQADEYYTMIKSACDQIKKNPNIGNKNDNINKNLQGFNTGKHIIFYYLISNNEIEVVRILHQRMDLKNRLTE